MNIIYLIKNSLWNAKIIIKKWKQSHISRIFSSKAFFIVKCISAVPSLYLLSFSEPNSMKVRSKSEQKAKVHRVWLGGTREKHWKMNTPKSTGTQRGCEKENPTPPRIYETVWERVILHHKLLENLHMYQKKFARA